MFYMHDTDSKFIKMYDTLLFCQYRRLIINYSHAGRISRFTPTRRPVLPELLTYVGSGWVMGVLTPFTLDHSQQDK